MCCSDWQADYWRWSVALSAVTRAEVGGLRRWFRPLRPATPLTQLDWSSIKPSPDRMMDRSNCFLLRSQPINVEWLHFSSSAGATNLISGGSGWRRCQIARRHLLYAGAQFGTARATTPNVVCDGGQAGPGHHHGDGDRSKGRRSDVDDHRAGRGPPAQRPRDGDGGVRLLCDALRPEHKDLITEQLTSDWTTYRGVSYCHRPC